MSRIRLSGDASGSGTLTIAAPNTNSDRTLTLPDNDGTLVTTGGAASLTTSGNLTFTGTGNRITGDFSNATLTSRVMFQTSTTNGLTLIRAIPNGTATQANIAVANSSDPANCSAMQIVASATDTQLGSIINGTGTYLPMTFYTGGSERLRIDTSGNVGVGTTSPSSYGKLTVDTSGTATPVFYGRSADQSASRIILSNVGTGGQTWQMVAGDVDVSNSGLSFYDGTATRMRIDSSGNLLVGTTNASPSSGAGLKVLPAANGASSPQAVIVTAASTNSSASLALYSTGAATYRFYVADGGTIYATSTSISAISDRTLKENIRDLETGLTEVMALKPRRFDWKNGDAQNVAGFVAQEVEEVLPELVTDYVYNKDENGNDIIKKSLKMGDILPTLVKAIQELNAKVEAQAAEIAQLKGAA